MTLRDADEVWILGTKYSRLEILELEEFAGKTTLAGDFMRFGDAWGKFAEEFKRPFRDLYRRFGLIR